MLINPLKFDDLEVILREKDELEKFERESGEISGRAMITFGEVPYDLKNEVLKDYAEEDVEVFNCSFDFYDSYLGIALEKRNLQPVSGVWVTEQVEGADRPKREWIEFFIRLLVEYVVENKDHFGIPLYIFLNDDAEMVVEPTLNED